MSVYYNEFDPFAAAWLRGLVKARLIPDGEVDTRSIVDVRSADLRGFTQCHFFAGIGGWAYALGLAGWPSDRAVWTGSCPCQPFSQAGDSLGGADPRDLWPAWYQLIRECRPPVVFGEQVEGAINHGWLDRLCDDLEREEYAVGAVCLPAAGVGAYHIRQRLWFVADRDGSRRGARRSGEEGDGGDTSRIEPAGLRDVGELGNPYNARSQGRRVSAERAGELPAGPTSLASGRAAGAVEHAASEQMGISGRAWESRRPNRGMADADVAQSSNSDVQRGWGLLQPPKNATARFWDACEWLACVDGKSRPIEPGTFPLAYGVPARVGRLRGYGNAIVPQVAQAFIEAYLEW